MASSTKCHQGTCGPCFLCRAESTKYTHPEKFDAQQYTFLCEVESASIDKCVCICYACSKQLKRNVNNPKFQPRWRQDRSDTFQKKCSVQSCENAAQKKTSLASAQQIEHLIGQPIVSFTVEQAVSSVNLCQVHYNHLYSQLTLPVHCESCGGKPRKGEHFNRHCPEPDSINTYLALVSSDSSHLTDQSLICTTCYMYKHFRVVLSNVRKRNLGTLNPVRRSDVERNSDIDQVISALSSKISIFTDERESIGLNGYLEFVACVVAKKVGERMKADVAMLLPALHNELAYEAFANVSMFPQVSDLSERDIPTSRWLLSLLHLYFEDKLEVQCRHRRYGTLLFHTECDLIQALSTALGQSQNMQKRADRLADEQASDHSEHLTPPAVEEQVQTVALYLNDKLHNRARALNASYNETPEHVASINLTSVMANTDPVLVSFLTTMTQSVRQSKRKLFHDEAADVSVTTKTIRLLYALSVLQFCTNSMCNVPFHIVLTEAVLCHGGTLELVRILNRLGAVASIDTANRLATHIVQTRLSRGIKPDLQPQKFTAVSIDNIDILQSHGFVSCQDATRSWHGTSVQCVQPLPFSGHLTPEDLLTHVPQDTGNTRKRLPTSPAGTPIPTEKHKRRRRTLTEQASPHTGLVNPTALPSTTSAELFDAIDSSEYRTTARRLSLAEFSPNAMEQSSLDYLQTDLFQSVALRAFGLSDSSSPYPQLPSLVNCIRKQAADKEVSNVTYIEIISERADSKPTLIGVISRLQKIFVQELNQKYVIIVGDAKRYNLLQEIRYEYKSQLKWMIPFPGDWHVLYNYQKALLKPYADAGLASLGKVSGHRAETLTSLLQGSNFRRTHEFLLQSYEAFYRYFLSLYVAHVAENEHREAHETIEKEISDLLSTLATQFNNISSDDQLISFRETAQRQLLAMPVTYSGFKMYMEGLAKQNDTVSFWYQFAAVDCFAYLGLFIALRYRKCMGSTNGEYETSCSHLLCF